MNINQYWALFNYSPRFAKKRIIKDIDTFKKQYLPVKKDEIHINDYYKKISFKTIEDLYHKLTAAHAGIFLCFITPCFTDILIPSISRSRLKDIDLLKIKKHPIKRIEKYAKRKKLLLEAKYIQTLKYINPPNA